MKKITALSSAAVLGVFVAGSVTGTAFAWHPQGKITKYVQNVTTGVAMADANTEATAIAAKPGDILQYTIKVENPAKPADKNFNDLAFTKMTDTLPAGVEQVENAAVRTISEDLGTILPGKSVTKTYKVKVTATADGYIKNTACFSGDSLAKDSPKTGCDAAIVKVTVPVATPPVVTPPVVETPVKTPVVEEPGEGGDEVVVETPEELPEVGIGALAPIAAILATVGGFFANTLRLKKLSRKN